MRVAAPPASQSAVDYACWTAVGPPLLHLVWNLTVAHHPPHHRHRQQPRQALSVCHGHERAATCQTTSTCACAGRVALVGRRASGYRWTVHWAVVTAGGHALLTLVMPSLQPASRLHQEPQTMSRQHCMHAVSSLECRGPGPRQPVHPGQRNTDATVM